MKLHEYQAKQLFAGADIPVPQGVVAASPGEASAAYETLRQRCGSPTSFACNVKAQLHAGGRGKAGGIQVAHSAQEAEAHATTLLGQRLVTKQTGSEGLPVSAVLLDERIEVDQELYLAVTVDRFHARPMVLASRRGGVDIEEVAASEPAAITREPLDIEEGAQEPQLARLAGALGLSGEQAAACGTIIRALWALYQSRDASLIEINPLVTTRDRRLLALDAKVTLDDNALFRHEDLAAWRDESQEHALELKASRIGISYVGLSGNIGCLVNGAGLAMATNDIIKLSGGNPANFLDVGGGANVEQVTNAFSIILADARVTAVLVNIFGGIMRCDWIAQGLINATQQLDLPAAPLTGRASHGAAQAGVRVPIVVRLQGTNVEQGRKLLADPPAPSNSGRAGAKRLNLISVDELADAARRVVELAAAGEHDK